MSLSDKALPKLIENKEILSKIKDTTGTTTVEQDLVNQIARFEKKQKGISWLSWNHRDWQTIHYLNENK